MKLLTFSILLAINGCYLTIFFFYVKFPIFSEFTLTIFYSIFIRYYLCPSQLCHYSMLMVKYTKNSKLYFANRGAWMYFVQLFWHKSQGMTLKIVLIIIPSISIIRSILCFTPIISAK